MFHNKPNFKYLFAHNILPAILYKDGLEFIRLLQEKGISVLLATWIHWCKELSYDDESSGLGLDIFDIGLTLPIVLVTMPELKDLNECYIVAMAVTETSEALSGYYGFYYTLEYDPFFPDNPAFCEWDEDGSHLNYGRGPDPTPKDFLEVVKVQIMRFLENQNKSAP